MTLTLIDWLVIAGYFALNLAIGLYYAPRAAAARREFFLSGRNVPWWLAGTSMVATTFAADTPLVVTGMVARYGIAGNWLWWNMAASGMLTVFVYARLWRRAGVMTDVEFAELRYSGTAGRVPARLPRALSRHPDQLHRHGLGQPGDAEDPAGDARPRRDRARSWSLLALLIVHGVLHDARRAVGRARHRPRAVRAEDGHGRRARLFRRARRRRARRARGRRSRALDAAAGGGSRLAFFPSTDSAWMPAITLFVYLGVSWWASWYPGAEPGGGGYVAQRIFSREGRAPRPVRDAVVQHRALRGAPVAVDPDGARVARALSRRSSTRSRATCAR